MNVVHLKDRCCFSLHVIFKCENINIISKIHLYRTDLKPMVMYVSKTWAMTVTEEGWLRRSERKVLRKIFGAVMQQIYGEPGIVNGDLLKSKVTYLKVT